MANRYTDEQINANLGILLTELNLIFSLNKLGISVTRSCWKKTIIDSSPDPSTFLKRFVEYAESKI